MRGLRHLASISKTANLDLIEMNDPNEGIETCFLVKLLLLNSSSIEMNDPNEGIETRIAVNITIGDMIIEMNDPNEGIETFISIVIVPLLSL